MMLPLELVEEVSADWDELCEARPSMSYSPGRSHDLAGNRIDPLDNGQLQFHQAQHIYRLMAPGNGFGKTAVSAVEVDWWGHGDHPWQEMPDKPRQMLWVAQKFQQFEMQKPEIEKWWPQSVRNSWHDQDHTYTWPDGSTMFVITAETDWKTIQGTQPDLILIDEECGPELWHELQRRRRAPCFTRYAITATATNGLTWTYRELYKPWLAFHAALGMDEREAMRQQKHVSPGEELPGIWCWPKGSHAENPRATKASWAEQQNKGAGSDIEKEVRLYGGYRDFAGKPVFNLAALERQRKLLTPGKTGWLVSA